MGLGMQLTGWPDDLVQLLVSRGFRVIRLDSVILSVPHE